MTGFTGLLLRKDFMESVEMLKRISGMVGHSVVFILLCEFGVLSDSELPLKGFSHLIFFEAKFRFIAPPLIFKGYIFIVY